VKSSLASFTVVVVVYIDTLPPTHDAR
jgi:hypothetical protein